MKRPRKHREPLDPYLRQLGAEIRAREEALDRAQAQQPHGGVGERQQPAPARRWRRPVSAAGVLLAGAIGFILLETGGAGALDIINRAPAAAARSESVHFTSEISIDQGPVQVRRFTEAGKIDFPAHAYSTALHLGHGEAFLQRRVAGVFYTAQVRRGSARGAPVRWLAIPLAHEASSTFASAPESEEFTSPLVLLDELGGTRAPVVNEGPQTREGVPTTRYHLETNVAALLGASPGAGRQPASYRSVVALLTVWLDAAGRPHQVDETFTGPASTGRPSISTVVRFSDYGQPITISPPRAIAARSKRTILAPNPLAASPSRLFERQLFARP